MVLVAVAAVSVAPVMDTADRVRRAGMRDEVARRLLMARSHAMTCGRPTGVCFDLGEQTAAMMEIATAGGAPAEMDADGNSDSLAAMFAGAAITDADLDDGDVYDTVWFSHDGTPHFRTDAGVLIGGVARDAVISMEGGAVVTVRAVTGLIE